MPATVDEAGKRRPCSLTTTPGCRREDSSRLIALRSRDAGIHAEAGILAPEPWTARLQLRDSAGFAPDFPHFSLTPSDEALCCAFGCGGTLPRGPAVVKDARLASDYGRMVNHARVVHEVLTSKFSESERATLLRTLNQIAQ